MPYSYKLKPTAPAVLKRKFQAGVSYPESAVPEKDRKEFRAIWNERDAVFQGTAEPKKAPGKGGKKGKVSDND